ncbi:MAG: RlmE family RNA methyltransferase, partial [Gammaproteobacteria bacterium]|nr:RlmE family RNA methyltransferase [Gammaproteobacteria bacterium]
MSRTKRSASSDRWQQRQSRDPFVKQARVEGYNSRAAYKLIEIDQKDRLLKGGMTVLDLGAAPGSWSQYAKQKVGDKGVVVAVDLLPINAKGV